MDDDECIFGCPWRLLRDARIFGWQWLLRDASAPDAPADRRLVTLIAKSRMRGDVNKVG